MIVCLIIELVILAFAILLIKGGKPSGDDELLD